MINWKNDHKTSMWYMAGVSYQQGKMMPTKDNIDFLKENLDTLFKATTQKTAGQRPDSHDVDWDSLDITLMNIAISAACLYKSGMLDKLQEMMSIEPKRPQEGAES